MTGWGSDEVAYRMETQGIDDDEEVCEYCNGSGMVKNYSNKGVHVCLRCLKKMGEEQHGK